jgi:dsRNA-specific ribonuclease
MLTDEEIQKLHNSALHDRRPQMVSAEVICQLCNSYSAVPTLIHEREDLLARVKVLEEALMDATAHLVGAVSAYDKFRNKGATGDPFYKTRIVDFNRAVKRARNALQEQSK